MMTLGDMSLDSLSDRLWGVPGQQHTYAILDGASNEGLLDMLYTEPRPGFECLLTGELAPDMAYVAPYVAELVEGSLFSKWALREGWGNHWGIFALSRADLPEVWRHLRALVRVFDPQGNPMYFRFYDPRVLRAYLPNCAQEQLRAMFGPVDKYVVEGEAPNEGLAFSLADGALVTETFKF
jgi:hypothetical protein